MNKAPVNKTLQLAKLVADWPYGRIPSGAIRAAKIGITDGIACAIAGAGELAPEKLIMQMKAEKVHATTSIFLYGRKELGTSSLWGALINGASMHALDYDDVNHSMMGHPTVAILPAVLGASEMCKASGAEILAGYIIGIEVSAKLGKCLNPQHYDTGWHATSTLGTFGAAAGACRVMGLKPEQVATALGVSMSLAGGTRQNFGTDMKPFHAGWAARNGLMAAMMAGNGFTAEGDILSAEYGPGALFVAKNRPELSGDIISSFGKPFDVETPGLTIKKYPCCAATHSSLDAMFKLLGQHGLKKGDIVEIHAEVGPLVPEILIHHNPKTGLHGKFSLEYVLAGAILYGKLGLAQFTDDAVNARGVRELMKKVKISTRSMKGGGESGISSPAIVSIKLKSGRLIKARVNEARGNPKDPLSGDELKEKFLECTVTKLGQKKAFKALDLLGNLNNVKSVRQLTKILAI